MSDKIMAGLPDDFVRRMRNWARARAGLLSSMGVSQSSIYDGPIRVDRNPEARLPILEGEAKDTGVMLARVPARYRQAVELWWDHEGAPLRWLARKTGKQGVNKATFVEWVMKGHELLQVEVKACSRRWKEVGAENARLASLGA